MECEYCHNIFSTKSILNSHQKTAKYCLSIRNQSNVDEIKCKGCGKTFSRMSSLDRHTENCTIINHTATLEKKYNIIQKELEYKNNYIEKLEQTIKELQDKLENIAISAVSRPTTSTTNKNIIQNNYIQNLQPITDEVFTENIPNLTIEHIMKGPIGYAEYALEFTFKNRVVCVDYARRKVKFKDKDGNIITDPEMTNLGTKFFESICEKNIKLILEYQKEFLEKYGGSEFDSEEISKMLEYMLGVKNAAKGDKTEFHNDFVKEICNKTIKD